MGGQLTSIVALCFAFIAGYLIKPAETIEVKVPEPYKVTITEQVYIKPEPNEERDCMAQALYAEARGEGLYGQMVVGQVIMNRVQDHRYPDTICEVVNYKPAGVYHFSYQYKDDPNFYKTARVFSGMRLTEREKELRDQSYEAADMAIAGLEMLPASSLNYHSADVVPVWSTKLVRYAEVGDHIFYTGY